MLLRDLPRLEARRRLRVLRVVPDEYDPQNEEHRKIRQEILIGNGLPTARHTHEVLDALKKAGFEVTEEQDLVKTADVSWYEPIDPDRAWRPWRDFWSFKTTWWERNITHYLVLALETVGIAPKGAWASAGS